jgi:hypothetical protein
MVVPGAVTTAWHNGALVPMQVQKGADSLLPHSTSSSVQHLQLPLGSGTPLTVCLPAEPLALGAGVALPAEGAAAGTLAFGIAGRGELALASTPGRLSYRATVASGALVDAEGATLLDVVGTPCAR